MTSDLEASLSSERRKRQKGDGELPHIPAISLRAMFGDDADAKAATAREWDHACRAVGFIKIKDHGVPREVIDDCWEKQHSIAGFNSPFENPELNQEMPEHLKALEKSTQTELPGERGRRISTTKSRNTSRRHEAPKPFLFPRGKTRPVHVSGCRGAVISVVGSTRNSRDSIHNHGTSSVRY